MTYFMHVNYLEWLDDLGEIARRCADAGFDGIELRGFDRTGRRSLEEYLDSAADAAQAAGLEDVVYGCPNDSASADPATRGASRKMLQKVIRHAGQRGYRRLNVFASSMVNTDLPYYEFDQQGSAIVSDEQRRRTAEYFHELGTVAAEHDVLLCFETHNNYPHDLPMPTRDMIESIGHPNVAVNFDYGNIYLHPRGGTIDDAVDTLGPHIRYVHLKNMMSLASFGTRHYRGTPLRDGDINHEQLVRKLLSAGYDGPLTIENVMPGDKHHLMADDLAYLREVVARVAAKPTRAPQPV